MGIYEADAVICLLCGEDVGHTTVIAGSVAVVIGAHLRSEQLLEEGGWQRSGAGDLMTF